MKKFRNNHPIRNYPCMKKNPPNSVGTQNCCYREVRCILCFSASNRMCPRRTFLYHMRCREGQGPTRYPYPNWEAGLSGFFKRMVFLIKCPIIILYLLYILHSPCKWKKEEMFKHEWKAAGRFNLLIPPPSSVVFPLHLKLMDSRLLHLTVSFLFKSAAGRELFLYYQYLSIPDTELRKMVSHQRTFALSGIQKFEFKTRTGKDAEESVTGERTVDIAQCETWQGSWTEANIVQMLAGYDKASALRRHYVAPDSLEKQAGAAMKRKFLTFCSVVWISVHTLHTLHNFL